jgi:SOS-response transcriptional repressor LexA/DNA-binding XRE family transcriptional regulator
MIDIAEKLREIRATSGLSQQKMADLVGIPQRTWSSYESGQTRPRMDVLFALAEKGYPIRGLTTSLIDDWPEEKKLELQRRIDILKTGAFDLDAPMTDIVKMIKAVDAHPSPYKEKNEKDTSELLQDIKKIIHKIIEDSPALLNHESRLSDLESRPAPNLKIAYPAESGDEEGYTADPAPEYGRVTHYDDVAAGPPVWQVGDASQFVDVPIRLIKTKPEDYFTMRVRGNSMIDAFIPDGSLVLIRRSDAPKHGKVQVVWIDNRVTIKRMREDEDHGWTLCHEDGSGDTIPLGEKNLVRGDFAAVLPPATRPRMRGE